MRRTVSKHLVNMSRKFWCGIQICFVITICHQIAYGARLVPKNKTDNTFKYSRFAYSAYSSFEFSDNSTLVLRFKTTKKRGMLFYIDDGGTKEFMDAFLLNGRLRIRITMGSCQEQQRFLNGSFADLKWHKLTLQRTSESVLVTVDRAASSYVLCHGVQKTDFKKHGPLYISYFPSYEWSHIKWTLRDSLWRSLTLGGFEGCMKTPRFATGSKKLRRARLLKSEHTIPGCRDACKDPSFGGKCHNGGKCVNRIVRRECDCRGTGFNGPNCSRVAIVDSTAGLRFTADSAYAEFTGWSMSEFSELQFYFKTGSNKPAILLYQDNGVDRDTNDYLEVSLVKYGHVRLQLRGDGCSKTNLYIRHNFTDNSWHKLKILRHGARLNLSVDNISSEYTTCVQPPRFSERNGKAQSSLFMGGIPIEDPQGTPTKEKWALTGLFLKVLQESSWFHGCIALLRYSSEAKPFENVKLLGSKGVWENCSGEACSSFEQDKCRHGGICVDLVVKTECDCKRTGYYGRFCERSVNQELTTTSEVRNTALTTAPDHTKPIKDNKNDEKNPGETKGEATARKNKKARNEASSVVVSPGWCLVLCMGSLLMRTATAQ